MRTRVDEDPFLAVAGEVDHTVHPKTRVFALQESGEARAYTYEFLSHEKVITESIYGRSIVVLHDTNRNITKAYRNEVEGEQLSFQPTEEGTFIDKETGTQWDVLGRARSGPYAGYTLEPIPFSFEKLFWFAWKQYHAETTLFRLPKENKQPETADIGPRNTG